MTKKNIKILSLLIFVSFVLFGFFYKNFYIQASDSDAIAVRIIPNTENHSARIWYGKQGFSGNPKNILVDGYRAIRSDNTVYVNVGNAVDTNADNVLDRVYTNINIISFSENSDIETEETFKKIIENWSFNANVNSTGFCFSDTSKICVSDSDCGVLDFCDSDKAKLIRDVRRMEDMATLREALEKYKNKTGTYPSLNSGTYLNNVSLSTWSSWQSAMGAELNTELPVDPVNKLGACPGFNIETCWNEENKSFPTNPLLGILPAGSHSYLYITNSKGEFYQICFSGESGYANGFTGDCTSSSGYMNRQPEFISDNFSDLYSGLVFEAFISVQDLDSDNLLWTFTSPSNWASWSGTPVIQDTSNPYTKKIYASIIGDQGVYSFDIRLDDQRGEINSQNSKTFSFEVVNPGPALLLHDITYTPNSLTPLNFSFEIKDPNSNYPLTYSINPATLPDGVSESFFFDNDKYVFEVDDFINNSFYLPSDTTITYTIVSTDSLGVSSNSSFDLNLKNSAPLVDTFNCPAIMRSGDTMTCFISAYDTDGHDFSYSISSSQGTALIANPTGGISISNINIAGANFFDIEIEDEYGAVTVKRHEFIVNSYCGDGVLQSPNWEGRGGLLDDGYELCDGLDGVSTTVLGSSPSKMYTCNSFIPCGLTGSCLDACTYLSGPLGGYCGDGLIQDASVIVSDSEDCDFGADNNCCTDCKWACPANGYSASPLKFISGESNNFNNGDSVQFSIPSCISLGDLQADVEKTISMDRIAIVFVIDTSGSMPNGMINVKTNLINSLNTLHNADINTDADLNVGLVRFSTNVSYNDINDIGNPIYLSNFVSSINSYTDSGSTMTSNAISRANIMLDDFVADKKIIILLSDGFPSLGQNPSQEINKAKASSYNIYTIAYTNDAVLQSDMCSWSSDNGGLTYPCYSNNFSYSSVDASGPYTNIISNTLAVPNNPININISGINTSLSFPGNLLSSATLNMSNLCLPSPQVLNMTVSFSGEGSVNVSNLNLDRCEECSLGSAVCGDGTRDMPNASGFLEECDSSDLAGLTCVDRGYGGGNLACSTSCVIDESSCCDPSYGAWSSWSSWGSCVGGVETRTRSCDNPSPSCGGTCAGSNVETRPCCVPSATNLCHFTCNAPSCELYCYNGDTVMLNNGEAGFCTNVSSGSLTSNKTANAGNYGEGWFTADYQAMRFVNSPNPSVTFSIACNVRTNWATYVFGEDYCNYLRTDTAPITILDGSGGVVTIPTFSSILKYNTGSDNNFGNFWWPSGSVYSIHNRGEVRVDLYTEGDVGWSAIKY